ncbi:Cytochrome P450 monooxygenase cicH [Exophiala dermatitidis]
MKGGSPGEHSLSAEIITLLKAHFVLFLVGSIVIRGLLKRYWSPLRRVPGPFLASCSRLWKVWSTYRGHTELDHIRLHKKYGPVVRTAPNEVSFASTRAAKDIFTVGKGIEKTMFYSVFPPKHAPDIFTEVREWKHAQMKRYAVTPYSMAQMQKRSEPIETLIWELVKHLQNYADSSKTCNLGNLLHYFAFDILGQVAFSRDFGFLDSESDVEGSIKNIDDVQWYDGIVGHIPELDILLRNNPLRPYLPVFKPSLTTMSKIAIEELARRKQPDGNYNSEGIDLLAELLRAHEGNAETFSINDVFSIAHGAVFAGSDSTASTMQSFFYLLLNHPRVYTTLQQEIDRAQEAGQLSPMITYAEALKLEYFQACLKEAMRIRPAVGLGIYRKLPPQGTTIDGQFFPGGTEVAVNGWVLHRDTSVFGEDVEEYRPERWFEKDSKLMTSHLYQFGGGSHLCIGRNLALFEMNKTLLMILRQFDLTLVHPGKPLSYHSTFFVVQEGLEVNVRSRR